MSVFNLFRVNLTLRDALVSVVGAGLLCHLIFNRLEPRSLWLLGGLPFITPLSLIPLLLPHCSNVAWATISTFAVFLSTLVVSTIAYRLSPFHPLVKYPGPVLNKASKLRLTAIAMGGKQHIYLQELHRKYGDVVRIGPNELSFCNSAAITPIMGPNGMPKGPYWDGRYGGGGKGFRGLVGLRDPDLHSKRRRIWSRAFSADALKYYQTILNPRVDQLVEALQERSKSSGVDLSMWINWFSYDFMNDISFGSGPEIMREGDKVGVWRMMKKAHTAASFVSHLPWAAKIYIALPTDKRWREFQLVAFNRVTKRYKEGSPNKDLFYHLIDEARLEPEPQIFGQVLMEAAVAIVGGSDTVSTALPNMIWFLLRHPQAYRKLQAELDKLNDSEISPDALAHLPYLNAVIKEALRLLPPVLSGTQRAPRIGSGGHMVGSHFIPEGTATWVPTYSLQRDERYFSLADQFIPERWLSAEERETVFDKQDSFVHDTTAFIPFSAGPADCIGKKLAYQEMRTVLCALLQKFDIKFADGYDPMSWERNLLDYYVTSKGNLPVILTVRS